jgi:hypothetical protein
MDATGDAAGDGPPPPKLPKLSEPPKSCPPGPPPSIASMGESQDSGGMF